MTLRSLFTASALVTIGMLVGRVLGLLREVLLAGTFGIGHEADMAIMLLIIPDFITIALVGGGASATLIPAFAARKPKEALELMWQALLVSVALLGLITAGIFVYAEQAHRFPELDGHTGAFILFLSSLPFTAATSILTAWLQYRARFTAPAFANGIFNGIVILTLWLMPVGLTVLAVGICIATLVRLFAHVGAFYRAEGRVPAAVYYSVKEPWQLDKALLKNYMATATSSLCGMFPQFAPYGILALAGGGVAIFNYAFKLILMPAMLGQGVIQMVLLPWIVHQRNTNAAEGTASPYGVTLHLAWIISLALCLSLSLASHEIVKVCFGYGKMTSADVDMVGHLFALGVWALPGMLLSSVWQQILFAHANPRDPLIANALLALLVVPACWVGKAVMGLEGLAVMYALIQVVPLLWLVHAACRLHIMAEYRPSFAYVRITFVMCAVWLPLAVLYHLLAWVGIAGVLLGVGVGIVTLGAGFYVCQPVREWAWQRNIH